MISFSGDWYYLMVTCAKFKEKAKCVSLKHSKVVSLQEFWGDSSFSGFKLKHVSVLVKECT
jgi:hypothetical protein